MFGMARVRGWMVRSMPITCARVALDLLGMESVESMWEVGGRVTLRRIGDGGWSAPRSAASRPVPVADPGGPAWRSVCKVGRAVGAPCGDAEPDWFHAPPHCGTAGCRMGRWNGRPVGRREGGVAAAAGDVTRSTSTLLSCRMGQRRPGLGRATQPQSRDGEHRSSPASTAQWAACRPLRSAAMGTSLATPRGRDDRGHSDAQA